MLESSQTGAAASSLRGILVEIVDTLGASSLMLDCLALDPAVVAYVVEVGEALDRICGHVAELRGVLDPAPAHAPALRPRRGCRVVPLARGCRR